MISEGSWSEFRRDLITAAKAWRAAPLLPLISVSLSVAAYIPPPGNFPIGVLLLLAVGWVGTERLWYLRIFRGQSLSAPEALRATWAYFWRFTRLGLMAFVVIMPVFVVGLSTHTRTGPEEFLPSLAFVVAVALTTTVIDILLTFVTPALAFSTRRVSEALRIGLRMLREEWPRCALYALIPPLAVVLFLRIVPLESFEQSLYVALAGIAGLFNLWFKGATAAFYLRRVEVGDSGSAFSDNQLPTETSA